MIVVKTANIYVTYLHLTTKGSELHLYQSLCICNAYLTPLIAYLQIVVYMIIAMRMCRLNQDFKSLPLGFLLLWNHIIHGGSLFVVFVSSTPRRIYILDKNKLTKSYLFLLKLKTKTSTKFHSHK